MVLKTIKSTYSIILLLVMVIIFLLLQNTCNPITGPIKTRQLKVQSADSRNKKLIQILRKTRMQDRTVIVSMVGQEWARPNSILDLFLESFRIGKGTKHLLNHLVIVAFDSKAFKYCKSIHPHCFYLSDWAAKKYATYELLPQPLLKYKFLQEVLHLGYNIAFTDADVMWFRNPLMHVDTFKEITIACDLDSVDPSASTTSNKIDGGFYFLKSNGITLEYLKYRDVERFLYPNSLNRSLCEEIVLNEENLSQMLYLRIKYMHKDLFGGFCQQTVNIDRVCTMHANCCDDIENKLQYLKLLLEDWRNENLPMWRAPSKCKV